METKEYVKNKIGEIELWLMDYKADYPKDHNECWRKRMPLVLGLSLTGPLLMLASRCDVWALYWALPMAWVLILLSTYMLFSKYKSKTHDIGNVSQSIDSLMQLGQYAEIVEYGRRKKEEADAILARKTELRNQTNTRCAVMIVAANIVLMLLIMLMCPSYKSSPATQSQTAGEQNPNFQYLGISNLQVFDIPAYSSSVEGSGAKIESQKCKVEIVDPWSNMTAPQTYAYMVMKDLEISNMEDDAYYCMKLVDSYGLPIPYLPDFLFSKQSITESAEVPSSRQDSESEKFENLVMMRNLVSQNPKFIIKRIY
ncbi:MAG: hypothetical protein MJZ66_06725 [Bacteroidales bacterium]|nr:hypothetical protein [Bacteroidales bacterium]